MLSTARKYWETVRWLQARQILWRIPRRYIPRRRPHVPAVSLGSRNGQWMSPPGHRPCLTEEGRPVFLNVQRRLDSPADWDQPDVPLLWRYHLHYFDDLVAEGAASRSAFHATLVQRWIEENAPVTGTGWDPYPASRRIVNWIKWALAGNTLRDQWDQSLALQAAYLANNIEWHILGNHLFANAKALVFAGLYFEGADADKWLDKGLAILGQELPEQVLEDGGHFERSPMYHALILEDLLDLINVTRCIEGRVDEQVVEEWRATAAAMAGWLCSMQHPDGEIAFFNDSAFGMALTPAQLRAYAQAIEVEVDDAATETALLASTGFARAVAGPAVLLADVGSVGPDYLPGHAHAGTLSFELSLFNERWLVNSGVSTYEAGEERQRQRGTAAHNTAVVDGEDSSEVWGGFRVARRARVRGAGIVEKDGVRITAGHDGYVRLQGSVVHSRTWHLDNSGLEISDRLEGQFGSACVNLLLHPGVSARIEDGKVLASREDREVVLEFSGGTPKLEEATWHPEFGLSEGTHRISINMTDAELVTRVTWGH